MTDHLSRLARRVNDALGSPLASLLCLLLMVAWGIWAWRQHFDTASQMVLNTATSVVTTLMAFLILHAQNKDSKAANLKMDELLRALEQADNRYRHIEAAPDATLEELSQKVENEIAA